MSGSAPSNWNVKGWCHAMFAFDCAYEFDLEAVGRILDVAPSRLGVRKYRRSVGTQSDLALRLQAHGESTNVHGFAAGPETDVTVHEFGGMTVSWRIRIDHPLEQVIELAQTLHDGQTLHALSRSVVERLLAVVRDAADRPLLDELCEDYLVFELPAGGVADSLEDPVLRSDLARLLRAESGALSEQEISSALRGPIVYRPGELCLVDWMSAMLVGQDMHEELQSLELANIELLELRVMDARLGTAVEQAYETLQRSEGMVRGFSSHRRALGDLARMSADFASLHENADKAAEAFGDDYLARVYREASERFHFGEWDAAVERKLGLLRNVFQQLADLSATRRSETLEWIIILLIAAEIGMFLAGIG